MLREHLYHPAVLTQVIVARHGLGHPLSIRDVKDAAQSIRDHFVGSEQEEVSGIGGDDVAHPGAKDSCCFALCCSRPYDVDGVVPEVGKLKVRQPADLHWRRDCRSCVARPWAAAQGVAGSDFRSRRTALPAGRIHPALQGSPVGRIGACGRNGNLVSPERALDPLAVNYRRPRPAFWRTQHDHRPASKAPLVGPVCRVRCASSMSSRQLVEHARERLMCFGWVSGVVDDHVLRVIAVATQELVQILRRDASKDGRVRDLVPVEVRDRKDRAVAIGWMNLFTCRLAASAPVSASPSPTTQKTVRSGWSRTAP